jgi:hypothetical protein
VCPVVWPRSCGPSAGDFGHYLGAFLALQAVIMERHRNESDAPFLERRSTRWLMIVALLSALAAIFIALAVGGGSNVPAGPAQFMGDVVLPSR